MAAFEHETELVPYVFQAMSYTSFVCIGFRNHLDSSLVQCRICLPTAHGPADRLQVCEALWQRMQDQAAVCGRLGCRTLQATSLPTKGLHRLRDTSLLADTPKVSLWVCLWDHGLGWVARQAPVSRYRGLPCLALLYPVGPPMCIYISIYIYTYMYICI